MTTNKSEHQALIEKIRTALESNSFVKMTLSKYQGELQHLKNVYIRLVEIQNEPKLSFNYRYETKDEFKNYAIAEGLAVLGSEFGQSFKQIDFWSADTQFTLLRSKKGKSNLSSKKMTSPIEKPSLEHNHQKKAYISPDAPYLVALGISSKEGQILKDGQKKFRQINKYLEIIHSLLIELPLEKGGQIVDMGSGKGYLTFALYDYLHKNLDTHIKITGIELRKELVDFCNDLSAKNKFANLTFESKNIEDFHSERLDMLIALHACDIATDIALAKGIKANANIIVVAPCCHKQIRKEMNTSGEMAAILKHGILEERQAELLTDGIRALILEANGYKTKVFEFISTEHTPKNVMIVGIKAQPNLEAFAIVQKIKAQFGIKKHYLEELLGKNV